MKNATVVMTKPTQRAFKAFLLVFLLLTTASANCPVQMVRGSRCVYQVTDQETLTAPRRKDHPSHVSRRLVQQNAKSRSSFRLSVQSPPSKAHVSAVQHCAALAAQTWESAVEVRAKFYFSNTLGRADILGDARPGTTWFVDGYLYPVAMAKSLLSEDVNGKHYGDERFDIVVRLNAMTNWYVGTDGNPNNDQYDLVTVCLHEVYHGLMISGGNLKIDRDEKSGTYSGKFFLPIDRRFDAFLASETQQGDCAISSYRGVDKSLAATVTGNALWFRSSSERVSRLYAPVEFKFGSSVYHLSDVEYGNEENINSLMTPLMPIGYAKHSIGPLILRMQVLMMNESESGAPLCDNSTSPLIHKDHEPRKDNKTHEDAKRTGCVLVISGSCLGVGPVVGMAIGGFAVIILVFIGACFVARRIPQMGAQGQ